MAPAPAADRPRPASALAGVRTDTGAERKPWGVRVGLVNWNTDRQGQYEQRRVAVSARCCPLPLLPPWWSCLQAAHAARTLQHAQTAPAGPAPPVLQRVVVHPGFNRQTMAFDIAVLVLLFPINNIAPIQLPPVPSAAVRQPVSGCT